MTLDVYLTDRCPLTVLYVLTCDHYYSGILWTGGNFGSSSALTTNTNISPKNMDIINSRSVSNHVHVTVEEDEKWVSCHYIPSITWKLIDWAKGVPLNTYQCW